MPSGTTLDVLTDGGARATLPGLSLPTLTQLAAAGHAASTNSSGAWNALADTAKTAIIARLRYGLDYLAGGDGDGVIYEASPGDPPPVQPAA